MNQPLAELYRKDRDNHLENSGEPGAIAEQFMALGARRKLYFIRYKGEKYETDEKVKELMNS